MNEWSIVMKRHRTWAVENEYPFRNLSSIKDKFDRLANLNKSTGDPTCPPNVVSAKMIGRAIVGRASAATLGDIGDDGQGNCDTGNSNEIASTSSSAVGCNSVRRPPGTEGIRSRAKENNRLTLCVEKMTEAVGSMASAMDEGGNSNVQEMVRKEVKAAMRPVEDRLEALIGIMKSMSDEK